MNKLKRKIKNLEALLNHDARLMNQSWMVLHRYTHSLRFVFTVSALAFTAGVALGYKRNFYQVTTMLASYSVKLFRLRHRARSLLSLLP